jgi:hypothetical protein
MGKTSMVGDDIRVSSRALVKVQPKYIHNSLEAPVRLLSNSQRQPSAVKKKLDEPFSAFQWKWYSVNGALILKPNK